MIIGIDASRSIDSIQKTGVEKVSDELIQHLVKLEPENVGFVFYTPQRISFLPDENQKILNWPFKYLWTQVRLAWEILFHPPDKLFFPVHTFPFILSFVTNRLSFYKIIHDIAFKKNPKLYNFWQRLYLSFDLKMAVKKCEKIFVPTESVKKDLLKYTRVSEDKIIVVHHGYRIKNYARPASRSEAGELRIKNYELQKKQILYVGRVEEKKNILNLIRGFEIFNKKFPEYKLILAGKIDPGFKITNYKLQTCHEPLGFARDKLRRRITNKSQIQNSKLKKHNSLFIIHNSIQFLDYISEEKKQELLAESICLALVSKEEGFGLPILEAFDFKLPVLASDIPVLREIGDGACLFVNPDSPEEIATGLEKIVSDEELCSSLVARGKSRLKDFSWEKAAQRILEEIMK